VMKHFFIILFLLLAAILQTTIAPFLSVRGAAPNLILACALALTLLRGFKASWFYVFLGGFFLDIYSGLPFGLVAISLIGANYLVDWLDNNVFSNSKLGVKICLIISGVLTFNFFLVILINFFHLEETFAFEYLFWSAAYNSIIAILIFNGAKKIFYKT
ncbi:MAG: rod shape-determining protein MreD, partial [Patescibacteria group bacterium]|nr:rod shape-determining protein MreD [Patescibacteria group bacterium]